MERRLQLKNDILQTTAASFKQTALDVFQYQATHNPLYAEFLSLLEVSPKKISDLSQIPFLPISLFKNYQIQTGEWSPQAVFTSSGTTGAQTSRHLVRDLDFYRAISLRGFHTFYPPLSNFCILALLPSYLERQGSSLVFMVQEFMKMADPRSDFFLDDMEALRARVLECRKEGIPILLIGVSFALLDLGEMGALDLRGEVVMETGGMKGRRRELTRKELHDQLKRAFLGEHIHSEYGMTELMSQGWSQGDGRFLASPSMQVRTRELTDPFSETAFGRPGALNIIDLGNLDTIAFVATDDLGRVYEDGSFEVLGRLDGSDIRGCNLLVGEEV